MYWFWMEKCIGSRAIQDCEEMQWEHCMFTIDEVPHWLFNDILSHLQTIIINYTNKLVKSFLVKWGWVQDSCQVGHVIKVLLGNVPSHGIGTFGISSFQNKC